MALDQVRTSDETVLETLANWAADVSVHWPELAVDRSARAFEDTIACMVAGADDLSPVKTRKGIANWGAGSSTVVGYPPPRVVARGRTLGFGRRPGAHAASGRAHRRAGRAPWGGGRGGRRLRGE